jgi:hypothetical protein
MRYRPLPVISPRAVGVILILIGMAAFILLATLTPMPASTDAEAGHAAPVVPAERNGLSW